MRSSIIYEIRSVLEDKTLQPQDALDVIWNIIDVEIMMEEAGDEE